MTNNADAFTQLVGPVANLTLTKQAFLNDGVTPLNNPLAVGDTFVYRLIATNNGPNDAAGVALSDPLPTGMTLAAPVPTGCAPGVGSTGTITCTIGTLTANTSATLDLHTTVGAGAANTAPTNTAIVTSTTADPDTSNTSASETVGVGQVANLALAKSVSPQTANVGDLVTYTFTVSNNVSIGEAGGGAAGLSTTGGLVSDALPAGLQFVSAAPGSACTDNPAPPETVTCDAGPVAPGATVTASFIARVLAVAAGTTVQNTASVVPEASGGFPALPDLNSADGVDHAAVVVNPQADLSLTKTVSNANPGVDAEVVYTLTASNGGPNDATGVTIHDSLAAGLDFIDATPGCDNKNGTVTCDLGRVAAGASASVTIRAHTTAAIAGQAAGNLATVSGNELDPNPTNNQASATIDVQPLVDLKLTKVASNPTPTQGTAITYTLTLANNGPSPASGVAITDPLPSGLSFVSASPGQGSCGTSGQTVTCQLGTVSAGGTALVTITANVVAAGGTSVQNSATASANDPIARPELLSSEATITPVAAPLQPIEADLSIAKKVNHRTARVGEPLTYTITVTNHGPDTVSSPTVTDAFNAVVHIESIHATGGSCKIRDVISCRLGSIRSGASDKITIVAKSTISGKLRNTASVISSTPDPKPNNNTAHATTNVRPGSATLDLSDTADRRTVKPGDAFSFTITVRSLGPAAARDVKVCDRLGPGLTYISVDTASFRRGETCWTIAVLAKGEVRRYTVNVRATATKGPRRLENVVTASATGVHTQNARATVELIRAPRTPPAPPPVTG
jgi:uncharacterized repeat protein (TIGR01451 family)